MQPNPHRRIPVHPDGAAPLEDWIYFSMTIGKKMLFTSGALIAVTLSLAGLSVFAVDSIRAYQDEMATRDAPKLQAALSVARHANRMDATLRGIILSTIDKNPAEVTQAGREFHQADRAAQEDLRRLQDLADPGREQNLARALKTHMSTLSASFQEVTALCNRGEPLLAEKLRDEKVVPLLDSIQTGSSELVECSARAFEQKDRQCDAAGDRNRILVLLLIGLAVAIGGAALAVVRQVNGSLRRIAADLADGARQVASAAGQVAGSSQSLAQGASEQAASLEETSATAEEINSMAARNSENSQSAAKLVEESHRRFSQANELLDQSVSAMGEISAHSDKISRIIRTIDEIAFQTNILALNAAVEAARAGETGLGFAVVADEVRNLAQRCAQSAKDTAALIEESISKSEDGKQKVDLVAAAIRTLTEESIHMKTLVDEVSIGSEEQARGISQIGQAISQMERVTQQGAAGAEEGASAAEEMNAQSEALRGIVHRLSALVGGMEPDRPESPHRASRSSPYALRA